MASFEVEAYNFIRARSPIGLRALIRKQEIKTGKRFKYQMYYADGYHYAWYLGTETIEQSKDQIKEEITEENKDA